MKPVQAEYWIVYIYEFWYKIACLLHIRAEFEVDIFYFSKM